MIYVCFVANERKDRMLRWTKYKTKHLKVVKSGAIFKQPADSKRRPVSDL